MDKFMRIVTGVVTILALVVVVMIISNIIWNNGLYTGRIAGEAEILMFKQGLKESIDRGTIFKWQGIRFVPAKTITNGMKNVIVKADEVEG